MSYKFHGLVKKVVWLNMDELESEKCSAELQLSDTFQFRQKAVS